MKTTATQCSTYLILTLSCISFFNPLNAGWFDWLSSSPAPKQVKPSQAAVAHDHLSASAKQALMAGTAFACVLGYWCYRSFYSKLQSKNNDVPSKIWEKTPKVLAQKIREFVITDFEKLAYEDREKLLVAVIPRKKDNLIGLLFDIKKECIEQHQKYLALNAEYRKSFESGGPRALYSCLVYRMDANKSYGLRKFLLMTQQQDTSLIFHKNNTATHILLARPLGAGEFALVGYTDGDIQIRLNDSDCRTLNNLSTEQREFIKGLYQNPQLDEIRTSRKEKAIFDSLPPEVQNCLQRNWSIIPKKDKNKLRSAEKIMQLCKEGFGFAGIFLGVEKAIHADATENKFYVPWLFLTMLRYFDEVLIQRRKSFSEAKEGAWYIPWTSLLLFEALKFGFKKKEHA